MVLARKHEKKHDKSWQKDDGKEGGRCHRVEINMVELDRVKRGVLARHRIDGCRNKGVEVKSAWCQRAPVPLPGLWYTPFNITALRICQREPGRRTVNCYFKLSAWICVTQCLVGLFRL